MFFYCPKCRQRFEVEDKYAGYTVKCSNCQNEIVIPSIQQDTPPSNSSQNEPDRQDSPKKAVSSMPVRAIMAVLLFLFAAASVVLLMGNIRMDKTVVELKKQNETLRGNNGKLQENIRKLEEAVNELKYGAEKMRAEALASLEKNQLEQAKSIFEQLFAKHPDKRVAPEFMRDYQRICGAIASRDKKLEEEKAAFEKAMSLYIEKNYDRMQKITWYETKRDCAFAVEKGPGGTYVSLSYSVGLYCGKTDDGSSLLRLRTRYFDIRDHHTWVFYDKVQLQGDNGVNIFIPTVHPEKKTEVGKGYLREWSDNSVNSFADEFSRLADAKKIYAKFYGKYPYEFELTADQVAALKEIMKQYQRLK